MSNISISASWTTPDAYRPAPLDRFLRRLHVLARFQRVAGVRRRALRAAGADVADPRMLADIGVAVPRNRGYDCLGRLAAVLGGRA